MGKSKMAEPHANQVTAGGRTDRLSSTDRGPTEPEMDRNTDRQANRSTSNIQFLGFRGPYSV